MRCMHTYHYLQLLCQLRGLDLQQLQSPKRSVAAAVTLARQSNRSATMIDVRNASSGCDISPQMQETINHTRVDDQRDVRQEQNGQVLAENTSCQT